jgi:hypothetical protein
MSGAKLGLLRAKHRNAFEAAGLWLMCAAGHRTGGPAGKGWQAS